MGQVDLAVGLVFFLFFFGLVTVMSIQHFAQIPAIMNIREYREAAMSMFDQYFGTQGSPSGWEDTEQPPSELGLSTFVYRTPILIEEGGVEARTNEPSIVGVEFDSSCQKDVKMNTVRLYDEDLNELQYELVYSETCQSGGLNESYVKFKTNITKNGEKVFYLYYLNDTEVPSTNYDISYSTTSWTPNDGDSWTEGVTSWAPYSNTQVSSEEDASIKISGDKSVSIYGQLVEDKIGLRYNPSIDITGISNGMYIDAWIQVDNLQDVKGVNVTINDGEDVIETRIPAGDMESGKWYHFERKLLSSEWDGWSTFNAANGLDGVTFYIDGDTSSISRNLKVDEFHFEKEPLKVKKYPEQVIPIVSKAKIDALGNLTYEELQNALGEDYKFRIEIVGE